MEPIDYYSVDKWGVRNSKLCHREEVALNIIRSKIKKPKISFLDVGT